MDIMKTVYKTYFNIFLSYSYRTAHTYCIYINLWINLFEFYSWKYNYKYLELELWKGEMKQRSVINILII